MSDRAVVVAVIGRGFGGRVVAPAYRATEGFEVLTPVSPRLDAEVAAAINDPRVDLVSVHSPPYLHERHVRMALEAGKSVLCDKPLTDSVEASRRLAADARAAPGVHLLNFEFRFDAARARTREMIADGRLGTVERVNWTHMSAGTRHPLRPYGWLFDCERGGGWIGAWASHAIDALRFMIGEVDRVVSSTPTLAITHRADADGLEHECTAEDGLAAVLTLTNGAVVTLDSTFAASTSVPPRLTIAGSNVVLENVGDERLFVRVPGAGNEEIALGTRGGVDRHVEPLRVMAAKVRDAVRTGVVGPGLATFADGLACDEVLAQLRAAPLVVTRDA